ncbi:MAG: ion transporter [Oscillospiraceae bacterium]|nr:ion transporter [Oscillospiraceae bacterium]
MRKTKLFALIALSSMAILLALLLLAESTAPDATIVSVPSALWYLLTTLTTVGYGDCYPVTAAGRVIGAVFQLMSLGVLALLFGMLTAFLRGTAWERIKLLGRSGKTWYIFSERNDASLALAAALAREEPKGVLLFANTKDDCGVGRSSLLGAEALCKRKKDGDFRLFCLSENERENERLANGVKNGRVYCRSSFLPDRLPENQQRFDPKELCARLYWNRFPLQSAQETVLLAGDGAYAEALLEQGLLRNVLDPAQRVRYVVAGDWSGFFRQHPNPEEILEIDPACAGRDELTILRHWEDEPELLRTADRIVFCGDDEDENRQSVRRLRRYFAVSGAVQARLSTPVDGADCFGAPEDLYTPTLVMHEGLSELAISLNERYRSEYPDAPDWNGLSDFARRSNLAAADHFLVKVQVLARKYGEDEDTTLSELFDRFRSATPEDKEFFRRIEHARWCRFHYLNGWRYAAVRDNEKRLHPLLVPFDRLSLAEQEKDDYSWELILLAFIRRNDEN